MLSVNTKKLKINKNIKDNILLSWNEKFQILTFKYSTHWVI
jgi:hypothetical protein